MQGRTPAQIIEDFPQLTLAQVYSALAYYWDNRELILTEMEEEERFIEEMKRKHPSKLREKLRLMGRDLPD